MNPQPGSKRRGSTSCASSIRPAAAERDWQEELVRLTRERDEAHRQFQDREERQAELTGQFQSLRETIERQALDFEDERRGHREHSAGLHGDLEARYQEQVAAERR